MTVHLQIKNDIQDVLKNNNNKNPENNIYFMGFYKTD